MGHLRQVGACLTGGHRPPRGLWVALDTTPAVGIRGLIRSDTMAQIDVLVEGLPPSGRALVERYDRAPPLHVSRRARWRLGLASKLRALGRYRMRHKHGAAEVLQKK